MAGASTNSFQRFVASSIEQLPRARNHYDTLLQQRLGTKGKPLYDIARKGIRPQRETIKALSEVLEQPLELLERALDGEDVAPAPAERRLPQPTRQWAGSNPQPEIAADDIEMVGINHSDAAFGLGAVFTDERPEVEVLQFPKVWVETITHSSPAHLSWGRARGSSMAPTINDGDMILLDHSERKVRDQDELWAFTVGEARGIKRLRVKGDRSQILSDNPNAPPDEEPIDFVNIVARVVFVGRRT